MRFAIQTKYRPFSLLYQVKTVLPGTDIQVTIYPTRVFLEKIGDSEKRIEISFPKIEGPVEKFCTFLDLDRKRLEVEGFSKGKFFRYALFLSEDFEKIVFILDRTFPDFTFEIKPKSFFETFPNPKGFLLKPGFSFLAEERKAKVFEKLFLGMNKKLDIELLKRRENLEEFLPLIMALSQNLPKIPKQKMAHQKILNALEKVMVAKEKSSVQNLLVSYLRVGFSSLFLPTTLDENFQGIFFEENEKCLGHPYLALLHFSKLIRSLFFEEKEGKIFILPLLLKEFISGLYLNLFSSIGIFHLEWRKASLRRMIFEPSEFVAKLHLVFPKEVKNFRLKNSLESKGDFFTINQPLLPFEAGKKYFFDLFGH